MPGEIIGEVAGGVLRFIGAASVLLLLTGCGANSALVEPECAQPAPFQGRSDPRAPGLIVRLADGYEGLGGDLLARYNISAAAADVSPRDIFLKTPPLPSVIAALRCDRAVKHMYYNQYLENVLAAEKPNNALQATREDAERSRQRATKHGVEAHKAAPEERGVVE